jgi:hypothetical protein
MVSSHPFGATVYLDGEDRGTTPLVIDGVSAGAHRLEIVLEGHRPWTKTVKLRSGARVVTAKLEKEGEEPRAKAPESGPGSPAAAGHRVGGEAPRAPRRVPDVHTWTDPWARAARRAAIALDAGATCPTSRSEAAVDAGLAWLARAQERDGSWKIQRWEGKHSEEGRVAVTGLVLMAFLGAGHTPKGGAHAGKVGKAITFLVGRQDPHGLIGTNERHTSGGGYNHAIAALALAEAYGMTRDDRIGRAVRKAVKFTTEEYQAGRGNGGFRYGPGMLGDLSVTGWFVMHLDAAHAAGLRVDAGALERALAFVDSCTLTAGEERGLSAYQRGRSPTPNMAAIGLIARKLLPTDNTRRRDELCERAAGFLGDHPPRWGSYWFFYGTYVSTQAMHLAGGSRWESWSPAMRDGLVRHQCAAAEEEALKGSWHPIAGGRYGGRAYATALACLCLEAYYRFPSPDGKPPGRLRGAGE